MSLLVTRYLPSIICYRCVQLNAQGIGHTDSKYGIGKIRHKRLTTCSLFHQSRQLSELFLKALSHECRISSRMRNKFHLWHPLKCDSCTFYPLNGRSSSGDVRCLYVLVFSFCQCHSFLIRSRSIYSFLMRRLMRHSVDRTFKQ